MQDNECKEEKFLEKKFKEFYSDKKIQSIPCIEKREFGIGGFGKKILRRHLAFNSYQELNTFLQNQGPLFISYSAAYYEKPAARPMQFKGLKAADLIYEFDASDIETKCKEKHNFWKCPECEKTGKGNVARCSECSSQTQQFKFPCENCLAETRSQTLKLIEVIENELGFSQGISVNFSGNAGYHVHIRSETAKKLPANARTELVDYLTLTGYNPEFNGFKLTGKMLYAPIETELKGAQLRVMNSLLKFIEKAEEDAIAQYGSISLESRKKREADKITSMICNNRSKTIEKIKKGILPYTGSQKIAAKYWTALIEHAQRNESIKLDRQTSIDIHKILRAPDTLHGSTGFIAKTISLEKLPEFNPFNDAIAFKKDLIKVFINKAPKFKLSGGSFGPFENETVELPEAIAIYLIGKKAAVLS